LEIELNAGGGTHRRPRYGVVPDIFTFTNAVLASSRDSAFKGKEDQRAFLFEGNSVDRVLKRALKANSYH